MSYATYKIMHLSGLMLLFLSLGAQILNHGLGGKKKHAWKKLVGMTHGLGMLLLLVGGFGLLARLQIHNFPAWVIVKLVIWLGLGALFGLVFKIKKASAVWWGALALGMTAAYLGVTKPF